ncbi:hypothetical protein BAE46_00970 [Glaciecola punicea]|jgi:hypothetical protein|uniref:AAA family ATPase n=1 Tax=Glaciecola punicea TaxID=56804 RepID=UPI000872A6B8|nr:AAA family ATPase [Glaciecola punicea]OFA33314.1 hypothetical protein BAE46_00970 [Glaciecola punicea]
MIPLNPKKVKEIAIEYMKVGIVPMIYGSPGIGKSDIVKQIAEQFNLELIDVRLSMAEPTDLNGFPVIENGVASYKPFDTFPISGTKLPKGKRGWLLFLDEANSAPKAVQAASYKIMLDRMVGNSKLHDDVAVMAAGNLETDNAIVEPMSTALQSRLGHILLQVSKLDWLEWAQSNNIDYRITSYIDFDGEKLHVFDADHSDLTFACPRTWEFANRLIEDKVEINNDEITLLSGVITQGAALEFAGHVKCFLDLPTIAQVAANPNSAKLPSEPSTQYAICGMLAGNADATNIKSVVAYIDRLPTEFQIRAIRETVRRFPAAKKEKLFYKKLTDLAQYL